MTWIERLDRRGLLSRTWRDDATGQHRLSASLAPLAYDPGDGSLALVDFTPQYVNNAQLDGWRITAAGWHYALGSPKSGVGAGEDGWVGFGGRRGEHWFRFRLVRFGYLHWNSRTWYDLGGAPTYDRARLSVDHLTAEVGPEVQTVGALATWRDLWPALPQGEVSVRWLLDGGHLKEEVVLDQAARSWIAANRPPSFFGRPASQMWLTPVFEIDGGDIPRVIKGGVLQDPSGDWSADGVGVELRDAADALLAYMPVDEAIVYDPATGAPLITHASGGAPQTHRLPLQKRFWTENAKRYLLVGARADQLGALPAGDLVFDPTIQAPVGSAGDDGHAEGTSWLSGGYSGTIYVGTGGAAQAGGRIPVPVSQGATIDAATLRLVAAGDNLPGGMSMAIAADDVDDASAWSSTSRPDQITPTTATTAWGPIATWASGTAYTSPSIAAVIQEIVDRPGWLSGNEMRFRLLAAGGAAWTNYLSFQGYSLSPANAMRLDITYTEGGGGTDLTASGAPSLPALQASGTAQVQVQASGAPSLPTLSATGAAAVEARAQGSPTLPALAGSGAAASEIQASGAPSLPPLFASGAAVVEVQASGSATLPALTASGAVTLDAGITAQGAPALPALAAAGAIAVQIEAVGVAALPSLTSAGTAGVEIRLSGAGLLPALEGSGAVGGDSNTASGEGVLPALEASGQARADLALEGTTTLPALTGSGSAAVEVRGLGAVSLPALIGSGTAQGPIVVGYLTARAVRLVPALEGSPRLSPALSGEVSLPPALAGDITLTPRS